MKLDRITMDARRMSGQPSIRDLRYTVRRVLEIVALYPDRKTLNLEFPDLEDEDIHQALAYAAANARERPVLGSVTDSW
jgi:uncharacterized protein (DUF433 family)